MQFGSSLRLSFSVCLISLSLICFICLTSAYFTTVEMADATGSENCPSATEGGKEPNCAVASDSVLPDITSDDQGEGPLLSTTDIPPVHHSDSGRTSPDVQEKTESSDTSSTSEDMKKVSAIKERFVASMVLGGVGDALGYHHGRWEFNYDGTAIHEELRKKLGGLKKLSLEGRDWIVSDDTVMHLATANALVQFGDKPRSKITELYKILAEEYIKSMDNMANRAPGATCTQSVHYLQRKRTHEVPFNPRAGGCGAAMRAMCIGLRYSGENEIDDLIAVSIESGRMTHHHPTGYLGAFAAALFTSYAIRGEKPVKSWGKELLIELEKAKKYVEDQKRYVNENLETWSYFENAWKSYLKERGISDGVSEPRFPSRYDVEARDEHYKKWSFSGWGGSSGHDAPMIAYDALLGSGDDWIELCKRGMLHGGDNDSTGTLAGAWFGALYGFKGVPDNHYKKLEYSKDLKELGKKLYELSSLKKQHGATVEQHKSSDKMHGTPV